MPLVLPFLLPGVQVNPLDIASSLVVLMLVPQAIGLVGALVVLVVLMVAGGELGRRVEVPLETG